MTLTPSFFRNFEASLDFYRIIIKGEIATVPLSTSFDQCLTTGDPTFCSLVVRSATGGLFGTTIAGGGYIKGTAINVANAEVRGVDMQSAYRVPLSRWGTLSFNLNGTYLANTTVTPLPVSLRLGVNNLLDRDPPVLPSEITNTGSGNVFASYDTLGREYFLGATVKF